MFYAACEGYFDERGENVKILRRIGYSLWMGGRTKKDPKVSEEDWMPLSGDKKSEVFEPPSKERVAAIFDSWSHIIKKKDNGSRGAKSNRKL